MSGIDNAIADPGMGVDKATLPPETNNSGLMERL
jgi:hypothetical protein